MRFALQSREENIEDSRCNEATNSSESNVGINL